MLHALVTSDWHFDGLINHFPDDHAKMVGAEVRKVYDYAVKSGIKYVIVPGDISDSYKMTAESCRELLSIWAHYDGLITTIYMKGNHDFGDNKMSSMDLFESFAEFSMLKTVKIVSSKTTMKLGGVLLNFCPFPFRSPDSQSKPCINFIHANVSGAVGDNGRPLKVREDVELAEGSFTFGGHIHKHQYLKSRRVVLVGNLYQKNFGESGPKGFVEFRAKYKDGKLKVKWDYIESFPNFVLETVIITKQKQFADLKADKRVRYRLFIDKDVIVPKNLRKDIPNIDKIVETKDNRVVTDDVDSFRETISEIPKINPVEGLSAFLKQKGLSKDLRKQATKIVNKSLDKIFSQQV